LRCARRRELVAGQVSWKTGAQHPQYNTVMCSTVQYGGALYSTVR